MTIQALVTCGCALLALASNRNQDVPDFRIGQSQPETLRLRKIELARAEIQAWNQLAETLEARNRPEAARAARLAAPTDPAEFLPIRFRPLRLLDHADPDPLADVPEARALRVEFAERQHQLRRDAADAKCWSLALEAARRTLELDPDHADARRVLGFLPDPENHSRWLRPHQIKQRADGRIDHPAFGWVPSDWRESLDAGLLPAPPANFNFNAAAGSARNPNPRNVRWLDPEPAEALRAAFNPPWEIASEHFLLRSNLPLERLVPLSRLLEDYYELFLEVMADVIGPKSPPVQRLLNPELPPRPARFLHEIHIFATRAQYVEHLRRVHERDAGESLGVYFSAKDLKRRGDRGASFFHNDPDADIDPLATLFHELCHQLLAELGDPVRARPEDPHYWVFEATGTYFETLTLEPGGTLLLGAPLGERYEAAKIRILDRGEFVPVDQLIALNRDRYLDNRRVFLNYAQTQAYAVYLMHAEAGAHRAPFLAYVRDVLLGQARARSFRDLPNRLGVPPRTLDQNFRTFLETYAPPPKT